MRMLLVWWALCFSWAVRAESPPSCLRHVTAQCRGPYVIRHARHSSSGAACLAEQWPAMTSCKRQCQKDQCCRAFGLLDATVGHCVTSMLPTEELHFVKESQEPYPASCLEAICAEHGCKNGGKCAHTADYVSCICPEHTTGERCEVDLCAADPCLHGSTCLFVNDTQTCLCISGFSGARCMRIGERVFVPYGILTVHMEEKYDRGDWGQWDQCTTGSYAAGIQLRIEPDLSSQDNTAVNMIRLLCLQAWGGFPEVYTVTSSLMYWGNDQPKIYCPSDFWIVQFRLYYQPDAGLPGDDTGVDGMEVVCRGPGMNGTSTVNLAQTLSFSDSRWSTWSNSCPPGSAVCTLRTRVEPSQNTVFDIYVDDGALTHADMLCCEY